MRPLSSRDAPGGSSFDSYAKLIGSHGFPEQSALKLAGAVMSHYDAIGIDPESDETLAQFDATLANKLFCVSDREDEDAAVLEGLDQLIDPGSLPAWTDAILRKLDWRHLYDNAARRYGRFRVKAAEIGLKPAFQDRVRDQRTASFESLPEDLRAATLDDDECRRLWLEKLGSERSELRRVYFDEFLKGGAAAQKLEAILESLPQEFALSEDARSLVLSDQRRLVDALDAQQKFVRAFENPISLTLRSVLRDLHIRRACDPNGSWAHLDKLGEREFIELVKYWSTVVAKTFSEVVAPPEWRPIDPEVVVRLYYPLLSEVVRRGAGLACAFAREILVGDVVARPGEEDWRASLLDLDNVVTQAVMRRFRPNRQQSAGESAPSVPSLGEWFGYKIKLGELLAAGLVKTLAEDTESRGRVGDWLERVNSERSSITGTAARILDWLLAGLVRTGQWAIIEPLIERLSGEFQRHVQLRATLNNSVAEAAGTELRKGCEQFVLQNLARGQFKAPFLSIELAVSFALQSRVEPEEILPNPDTAELNSLGEGWRPRLMEPVRLVEYGRRLKHAPKVLDRLREFYCGLAKGSEIRIHPAGIDAMSVELGELLYATGDARLNPHQSVTWPRTWQHLLGWHLSAGHGLDEYLRDLWSPRHEKDDDVQFLPSQIAPMRVFACMKSVIERAEDSECADVIGAQLNRLNQTLSMARMHDSLPKFHTGWLDYRDSVDWPDGGEFISQNLQRLPAKHLDVLETIYIRARDASHRLPGDERAWSTFAEMAVLLANHLGYPYLVTPEIRAELAEQSKQVLISVREIASTAAIGASPPGPRLVAALAVVCAFKDYASSLRQLLLIHREIPVPALPPSLNPQEASAAATGWSEIPELVSRLLTNSPRDQHDKIRFALGDYLQDRLKPRKPEMAVDVKVQLGEHAERIEVNPILRNAYVNALADLGTDRGGRLHRILGNVALNDPSPQVMETARRCAARAKSAGKEPPRGSVGRMLMNAWWWIRYGTNLRFGKEFVDLASARITKVREVTYLRGEI